MHSCSALCFPRTKHRAYDPPLQQAGKRNTRRATDHFQSGLAACPVASAWLPFRRRSCTIPRIGWECQGARNGTLLYNLQCKVCTKSQGIRNKIREYFFVVLVHIETGGPTSDSIETLQPYLNFENLLAMFDFTSRILLPRILVIQVPYS